MIVYKQFIIGRYLFRGKIALQRLFRTAYVVGKRYVDHRIFDTIICIKTTPSIFRRVATNVGLDGIVVNIKQYGQKGVVVLDGHTVEAVLKKMPAPRILVVVPPDKSGPEALEEAG